MRLFLDDVRVPYDVFRMYINPLYENDSDWVIVRNYYEFVNYITKFGRPDFISFDHDLSYDHYLEENQSDINYENFPNNFLYSSSQRDSQNVQNKMV